MISETFNTNNLPAMKLFPDKFFDLGIVDPPYGIADNPSRHGGTGAGKLKNRALNKDAKRFKQWDIKPEQEYFDELFRITKNQIIWGGNYFPLPPTRGIIAWDKCQPWENFSQIELAWTSFNVPAKMFKFDNRTGNKIHPTQKPIELYDYCFDRFSQPGFKVLDTHMGSQNSRISAYKHGLDYWGYEIDKQYYNDGELSFQEFLVKYEQNPQQDKSLKNQYRLL